MSLHATPQDHDADPPASWTVVKAADRAWRLTSSLGHTIDTFTTRRDAEEERESGRWVNLYAKEGRWFAGEPVTGWKPYAPAAS